MAVKWAIQAASVLGKLGAVLLLVYLLICAYLYFNQRAMIFYQVAPTDTVDHASVLMLEHAGERLKIWHIRPALPTSPVAVAAPPAAAVPSASSPASATSTTSDLPAIIYFGGNAENAAQTIPAFAANFPHHSIYLPNYRGYAGSTGSASEAALFDDALALYDRVRQQHGKIILVGRSLGSGVAVYLASQRLVEKLVLVTPYDSVQAVAAKMFPLFPIRFLIKDKFDSAQRADTIRMPTLMLLAGEDSVVPHPHSQNLFAMLAATRKQQETIVLTDHNSILDSAQYWQRLQQFLLLP